MQDELITQYKQVHCSKITILSQKELVTNEKQLVTAVNATFRKPNLQSVLGLSSIQHDKSVQ